MMRCITGESIEYGFAGKKAALFPADQRLGLENRDLISAEIGEDETPRPVR
jgi:hypothetical protein